LILSPETSELVADRFSMVPIASGPGGTVSARSSITLRRYRGRYT